MAIRYPITYEITPRQVDPGRRWLTVALKNVGEEALSELDVRLNSLDAYNISVYGSGTFVPELEAGEELATPFQVLATATTQLYISLDGRKGESAFHWESPGLLISVGQDAAELISLFALTEPYVTLGDQVRCEATIKGLRDNHGLNVQFWVEPPAGDLNELAVIDTKALQAGEQVRYIAEFRPDQPGLHTIYGYLYDGANRIGRAIEHVYVQPT